MLLALGGCAAQQSTSLNQVHAATALSMAKASKARRSSGSDFYSATGWRGTMEGIRDVLLDEADYWSGTPYRWSGESRSGIDCSALVQRIYRDSFDIDLPRTTLYQVLEGRRVQRIELQPGDLVFFRPTRQSRHVGIYMGDGRFLHASSSSGVRVSRLDNPYWMRHYWQSRRPLMSRLMAMRASP